MPRARVVRAPRGARRFDPVDLEILWNRLIAVVDEAAYAVIRTSMSKVVVEGRDFTAMLYDPAGRLLAADVSIASKTSTISIAVQELLKHFPAATLRPGDMLITNNPWWLMGHLNDIAIVAPIFYQGRLAGFAECMAHMADIGGCVSATPRELYEEGLIIPPLKVVKGGREDLTLFAMLEANVRVPRQIAGDVRALMAGCGVMQAKVGEFLRQHGMRDLNPLAVAILKRSEAAMRKGIAASIPDGVYEGATSVDGFEEPLHIRVRLSARAGEVDLDFTGSSPQSSFGINCTLVYTHVWSAYTIKCVAGPYVPNNEGTFAPIRVRAPVGSFLNPRFPAPVKMKPGSGHYIPVAILNALAEVVPKRILAESGNKTLVEFTGRDEMGRAFSDLMFVMGGMGARATKDGLHCISFPANSSNLPVEVLELAIPVRVHHKRLRPDSGGPGRFRGGCGQELELESVSPQPLTVLADHGKLNTSPAGLRGGSPGAAGGNFLNGQPVPDKVPLVLRTGDVLRFEVPGSGGMYPARERDPEAVRQDVENGIVTPEAAAREYGVVLNPETSAGVRATGRRSVHAGE
jgi:N-methylhydantoinase B